MTSATAKRFFGTMAGALGAVGLTLAASPANAIVFTMQDTACALYGSGCVFSYTDNHGNEFDDIAAVVAAYNAQSDNAPPNIGPLTFIEKFESDPGGGGESNDWTFENLGYSPAVSFYLIKTASDAVLLKGFSTPTNDFHAINELITNGNNPRAISHVNLYSGGVPNETPVPEPATWALLIMGFGAAGTVLRRRRVSAFG